jgi:N-acetylmuramic acid 6-phosphate etherase
MVEQITNPLTFMGNLGRSCRLWPGGSPKGKFLLDNWYFNGINTSKQGEHGMPGATEARHGHAEGLDGLPSEAILGVIQDTQLKAAEAVRAAIPTISRAGELAAEKLKAGGRLIYAGAGSSGLMALADGLELPGTFGLGQADVKILLAGGVASLSDLAGGYEDDEALALSDLDAAGVAEGDCVVCVTASGSTPYTLAIARAARARGTAVIGIANNNDATLHALSDVAVLLETPPEVVAGSTRMGAGTAQKIALNMLSTLMAIRLGHVHDGYMVNLKADNAKLQQRARGIVAEIARVDAESAAGCLLRAGGSVKIAALLASGVETPEGAIRLLANCNQNFRQALEMARAGQ